MVDRKTSYRFDVPRATLSVGVTGHRSIDPAEVERITRTVSDLLALLDDLLAEAGAADADRRMITALAAGSDQAAAEAVLRRREAGASGWALHAVIPFEEESYAQGLAVGLAPSPQPPRSFADYRRAADRCLVLADAAWSDPSGDNGRAHWQAKRYRTAGRIIVAQADLVIAIWRGGAPHGIGGTADVAAEALRQRRLLIGIDPGDGAIRIFQSGNEAADLLRQARRTPEPAVDSPAMRKALAALIGDLTVPPGNDAGCGSIAHFLGTGGFDERTRERARSFSPAPNMLYNWFKWSVLLGSGLQPFPGWRLRNDWMADSDGSSDIRRVEEELRHPLIAADAIATMRGHAYRSIYIAIYAGATLAVLIGLLGLFDAHSKWLFVLAELVVLTALIGLFIQSVRRRCHMRWLSARHLTEALRCNRMLVWIGFAGRRPLADSKLWSGWIANALMARPGIPDVKLAPEQMAVLAREMQTELVANQISYHQNNHKSLAKLHHRLDLLGWLCLALAILMAVIYIGTHFAEWERPWFGALVAIACAGLPLVAAAAAGIRFQGDFERFAERSDQTARALSAIDDRLVGFARRANSWHMGSPDADALLFEELVDVAHGLSDVLQADMEDWRFVYAARPSPGVG